MNNPTHPLFDLLAKLDAAKLHYSLSRHRNDSILVAVTLVGCRAEIDVFDDGHMEVSQFSGNEEVIGGVDVAVALIEQG
jgi:hypothetical protein